MTNTVKLTVGLSVLVTVLSLVSIVMLRNTLQEPELPTTRKHYTLARVAVFNGCGRSGLAGTFADRLRSLGFDVVNGMGQNADSFDYPESIVLERKSDASGKARSVAEALGIKNVLKQNSDDPYIVEEVSVILGRDWHTLQMRKEGATD